MKTLSRPLLPRMTLISFLIDIGALAFIYLIPTFSHLLKFPLYFIEPMRVMLILAIAHTTKRNAYILALTMPIFSFLISSHPELLKMILITFELSLNVFLFFFLVKRMKYLFLAILFSIIISKTAYYFIKFGLINLAFIHTGLISTPILIQLIITLLFSLYLFKFYKAKILIDLP